MSVSSKAMVFALVKHKDQKRKYTNEPYFYHLAQVVGIVASYAYAYPHIGLETMLAVSWLHDSMEDQNVTSDDISNLFMDSPVQQRLDILEGIQALTNSEEGVRARRQELACTRLSKAPGWVQTIKCADIISNLSSLPDHDPSFYRLYRLEKIANLNAMKDAHTTLRTLAFNLTTQ